MLTLLPDDQRIAAGRRVNTLPEVDVDKIYPGKRVLHKDLVLAWLWDWLIMLELEDFGTARLRKNDGSHLGWDRRI